MALVVKDRVKELTTTTGTADFTLGGAVYGFQTFSVVGNSNTTYYAAVDNATGDWEVGIGTYSTTGPTLTRDTVLESSNAGSKVVFAAGSKEVFVTYPAERSVYLDAAGSAVTVLDVGTLGVGTANITTANITSGTVSTTPSSGTDIANKTYVDTIASSGITYHTPVKYEVPSTTGNLNAIYNNGTGGVGATLTNNGTLAAFAPDGPTAAQFDRILVYNQTNAYENGVYEVTTVGSGSVAWVLTRTADADSYGLKDPNALGNGDAFFVTSGDTGAGETYVCNTTGTITFGTTNITFVQVSSAQVYKAGTGLNLSPATTFNISNTGVTANTYGSASNVPVFAVNAQGQITSVTNTAISIAAGAVSGLAPSATTDTTNASNITSGTLPVNRLSGSYTGITGVGTLTAGTWNGSTIGAAYGGTGISSYAVGDILYADTATSLAKLPDVVTGNALISGGVGTAPAWGKIGLQTHVSGTLQVANGGTGATDAAGARSNLGLVIGTNIPSVTGTGASGTWGINITGNAATATTATTSTTATQVSNSVTFNNSGTGAASGNGFNGSSALTVSYNTIGAPSTTGANASGTWNISINGNVSASADQGIVNQNNGNALAWYGRILSKNATNDRASFLGTYGSVAGVFAHNNALTAWADLYVNTIDGSTGGTVRMPSSVLINGNQALHAGNYTNYAAQGVGNTGSSDLNTITISGMYRVNDTNANRPGDYGQLLVMHGASDTITQIYGDYATGTLSTRSGNPSNVGGSGSWTSWRTILASNNFNSYAPTLTGGGASGTWGINITGSAGSAGSVDYNNLTNKTGGTGTYTTSGDYRAPIFYDSNNTAYYVDPAGNGIRAGYLDGNLWINPKSESYGEGVVFNMPSQGTWGGLRWYRNSSPFTGNWAFGYFGNEFNNDIGFHNGTNGWRLDHSFNCTTNGSFRAPIFYDSDNTGYYLDPASTGTALNINGGISTPTMWVNYSTGNVNGYNENIRLFPANNGVSVIAFGASGTSGTPWNSTLGFSDRFEIRQGNQWQLRSYADYVEAYGSFRAPIFYDSNNTGYYLDPSSTGTALNTPGNANFGNSGSDTGLAIYHGSGGGDYGRIRFYQAGTNNSTIHIFSTAWQGGSLQSASAGAINLGGANGITLGAWNTINSSGHWFDNSGNGQSSASFRSPIFYDSNNTAYYIDAASTSNLNGLTTAADISVYGVSIGRGAGGIDSNTRVGVNALPANTTGYSNTAIGNGALQSNTTGYNNTSVGLWALQYNTTGNLNVGIGGGALITNITGSGNVAVGYIALYSNSSGSNNTAIGQAALAFDATRSNCTALGNSTEVTGNNQVQLGNSSTTTYVYGTVQNRSDLRDKTDVADTALGLEFVKALRPVDYRWDMREDYRESPESMPVRPVEPVKPDSASESEQAAYISALAQYEQDLAVWKVEHEAWAERNRLSNIQRDGSKKRHRLHHGLIAQEVKQVIDRLGIDFGGYQDHSIKGGDDVLSIGYDELIAPLIKSVQELSAQIELLKAEITLLKGA